jgi:hypothetical protein
MEELTEQQAIELAKTGWWKQKTPFEVAAFQLQQRRLCMDFPDFHEAVEKSLERPVYTHEFVDPGSLLKELFGEKEPPSFNDILCMIPEDKLIIATVRT